MVSANQITKHSIEEIYVICTMVTLAYSISFDPLSFHPTCISALNKLIEKLNNRLAKKKVLTTWDIQDYQDW